ncbi:MAG: hypothetical protein QXT42_05300 [Thermoplasmata archaeon]
MFRRRGTADADPLTTLARCIGLLDDIRAYRRKDVEQIEAVFSSLKKTRFREHYDQWVKVRPYVEKIVDMPTKVPGVKKMITNLGWLKVVNRLLLIVLVVLASTMIVPAWRRALGENPFGGHSMLVLGVAVALVMTSLNLATVLDYRIRKRIIEYEASTMDEYAPAREKIKEVIDRMLRTLGREWEKQGARQDVIALVLYFDDYEHAKVVRKWRPKAVGIWKKPYHHFEVLPKP